jgi:hypothetical protein
MSGSSRAGRASPRRGLFLNILTFETMITGPVIHLLYWAGLGLIALIAFGVIGSSIGVAVRESTAIGALLSVPILVVGLMVVLGLVIAWRAMCEFYVAIFRIAEDLRALRIATETEAQRYPPTAPQPPGSAPPA